MLTLYPDGRLTRFALDMKTSGAAKVYWRRLNSKRSLPVLKWVYESEKIEKVRIFFADRARPSKFFVARALCTENMTRVAGEKNKNLISMTPYLATKNSLVCMVKFTTGEKTTL